MRTKKGTESDGKRLVTIEGERMYAKREGRSLRTLWAWSDVSWAEFENWVSVLGVMEVNVY